MTNTQVLNLINDTTNSNISSLNNLLNSPDVDFYHPRTSYGDTFIHAAIRKKNTEALEILLNHKKCISVIEHNNNRHTPLTLALELDYEEGIDLLLKHKKIFLKGDTDDSKGDYAMHVAVRKGNIIAIQKLIEIDYYTVHMRNKKTGDTPLHVAVTCNKPEVVGALLEYSKIDLSIRNNESVEPLRLASKLNYIGVKDIIKNFAINNINALKAAVIFQGAFLKKYDDSKQSTATNNDEVPIRMSSEAATLIASYMSDAPINEIELANYLTNNKMPRVNKFMYFGSLYAAPLQTFLDCEGIKFFQHKVKDNNNSNQHSR